MKWTWAMRVIGLRSNGPSSATLGLGFNLSPYPPPWASPRPHHLHNPLIGEKHCLLSTCLGWVPTQTQIHHRGQAQRLQTPSQPTPPTRHHQLHQQPSWQPPSSPFSSLFQGDCFQGGSWGRNRHASGSPSSPRMMVLWVWHEWKDGE